MKVTEIVLAAVATANHVAALPAASYGKHQEAVVQIDITDTATVAIQGRLNPNFAWVELVAAVSANTIQPITYMPEIRAVIVWTSGTVDVGVLTP